MAALNDGLQHTDSGNYRKTINIPTLSIPLHKLSIVLWTWDLGCTAYGERVDWNKRLLKSPRLALRLSLPYIYIYPHFPWFPTSRSCSPHQGVWVYSNAVYGERRWHALSLFDSVSMANLRVSWISFNLLTIMAYI